MEIFSNVDGKDREILRALLEDGRATLKSIARRVELPVTTTYNRMESLQEAGIFQPTVKLDWKRLGYGIKFFVLASVDTSRAEVDQEKLARRVAAIPNVLNASVITGTRDLLIEATAADVDELSGVVLKRIRGVEGVASTETLVVMKEFPGRRGELLK